MRPPTVRDVTACGLSNQHMNENAADSKVTLALSEGMQSVEEFMRRYLAEHIAEEKRRQAGHAPFRQTFYTDDCYWDSHVGTLELLQSEKVVSVSGPDSMVEVRTTRELFDRPGTFYDLRYDLKRRGDDWLISEVHTQCCSCSGEPGNESCPACHGSGWTNTNQILSKAGALPPIIPPEPETSGGKIDTA
jgi:hypothetical protein